ncbi:MAG: cobaltochelatase subunit CobN [Zoogloeaceae bacterium]|nr:cobaltochelatase subunit CobN [Zoogloeaceae bacterium]
MKRLLFLCLLFVCGNVWAKPLSVVLVPGDPATPVAVSAIKILRQQQQQGKEGDKALAEVRFHIMSSANPSRADLETLAASDVALVYNMGRELATTITPAVASMSQRGAKAYAIGSPFEEGEKQTGLARDETLRAYAQEGGVDNMVAMLRRLLSRDFGFKLDYREATPFPETGLWNPRNKRLFDSFEAYAENYLSERPDAEGRVWVGVLFNRVTAQAGASPLLEALMKSLETRGFNVAPVFGYPSEIPAEKYFLERGRSRVAAIVALALKMGSVPDKVIPVMRRLDVPAINAISLYNQTEEEWEASPLGLSLTERAWQVAGPEFAGAIAPTVVAAKKRLVDQETGQSYIIETPIPERVERLADRVKKWVALRYALNVNKRVAVIYYNYPPGKENIGASYLNVLPRSLWQILGRLEREGYDTRGRPATEDALFDLLREHGVNIGKWSPGALEKLVRSGNAVLLPVSEYRKWFNQQPEKLRREMVNSWGEPEAAKTMIWKDAKGKPHFVFPAQRFGNVLYAPQPSRGWEGDVQKMYHDVTLPPHHQYLAFYLWLQQGFKTHAMVHVGTHATHEWLSGREVGFTAADPSEAMVADVPQLYPYIVDDIGEALQAKRRGMATIISHMTPPFDKASLNKELMLLRGMIDDYVVAAQKSESTAVAHLAEINKLADRLGVLKDIGKATLADGEDVETLEHYLKEVNEQQTPYGLHTFGVAPPEKLRLSTAEAILSMAGQISPAEYERRKLELAALMEESARNELDALAAGLAGRYVAAGPGNDPIRNPDSLPTGRDLYGFDPARLPTPGSWEQGKKLAEAFVADYRNRHGEYPDRVVFNLWSTETMRHEGVTESEILALMGIQPVWDERGRTGGLKLISRQELGRPRVDVTIVPSGLYRDALPNLMLLLDDGVSLVKGLDEGDNPVFTHVERTRKILEEKGIAPEEAARMAAVRIFTEPSGAYGTGVNTVAQASNTWKTEAEVADVYFNRVGHLFGQGYWSDRPGGGTLAVDIFKLALKDAKAAIHARSSHLYGTLDNDDVLQYLGATSMAIRQVNGVSPETLVLNLADGKGGQHETLDKFMGREMRARYTNPEWVKAMLNEGYAGARFIKGVTDNLWGWQVTTPEAVDGAKWQEMYETYVVDRNALGVKDKFREAKNLLAYQAMVDKMLVAINKGYWQADPEVKTHLEAVNREVIAEAGVACDAASCSSAEVTALAEAQDRREMAEAMRMAAPDSGRYAAASGTPAVANLPQSPAQTDSASSPSAASAASQAAPSQPADRADVPVEGFEVREEIQKAVLSPKARNWALVGFAVLVLSGMGFRARRRKSVPIWR